MKKSIGLIADISSFNTTLPQTRHLNYFMGTNPRRYANGGNVSQGIPNYPNPNITNGFLPMALGFSKAGEVKKDDVLIIEFLKRNGALSENATKEEIEKFLAEINANEGLKEQIIEAQIFNREQDATNKDKTVKSTDTEKDPFDPNRLGLGDEFVNKRVTPSIPSETQRIKYENMPSEPIYKDGTDVFDKKRLDEIENVFNPNRLGLEGFYNASTPSKLTKNEAYRITPPGGYPGAPPANSQATSGIGPRLDTSLGKSSGAPKSITSIEQEITNDNKFSWSKLYDASVAVVAGYLKKDPSDSEVQDTAKKFISTEEGKKIAEQYLQSQGGSSSGAPPGLTPKETVTSTPSGGYPGAPSAQSQTTPKIGPNLNTIPGQFSGVPEDNNMKLYSPSGITEINKDKLDFNGDGKVDYTDYIFAIKNGLNWAIPKFKETLGTIDDKLVDIAKPDLPDIEINPSLENDTKKNDTKKNDTEGKPIIQDGGITGIGRGTDLGGMLETQRRKVDTLTTEDQNILKKGSQIAAGEDTSGGITDKKDVPSWALPMMSAGFAMMASKSPYFMQALGEAGQAGVESYSAQETAKEDKLDKQATRDLQKSQAKYYEEREQKPDIKVLTVDGKGVYHRWDSSIANADGTKGNYVSLNKVAVPSDAEIETELATIYGERWALIEFKEKQKLINEKKNQYLGTASANVASGNEAASKGGNWFPDWFSLSGIDKKLVEIDKRLNQ